MTELLAKAPPMEGDQENLLAPVTPQTALLAERCGFRYLTGFNMAEVSVPLVADLDTRAFGGCGKPRDGMEFRLVDANDQQGADGQVGELILRTDLTWTITTGYNGMPEATATATATATAMPWRNGWFHTGDVFRKDEQGNYLYVDRAKDAIRRRGKTYPGLIKVKREVLAHASVL